MRTLEEVKVLLEDNTNWGEILKDVVIQKFGENKIVTLTHGEYSHSLGDPDAFLKSVIVSNGNIFVYHESVYGGDVDGFEFGLLKINEEDESDDTNEYDEEDESDEDVYASQNALKEFVNILINGKDNEYEIEYDFDNEMSKEEMSIKCSYWIDEYHDEIKEIVKNGKGYLYN